ncbi:MAG: hypothetical protein ACTSRP_19910 [Candidatus Helarchaeota archaeon]
MEGVKDIDSNDITLIFDIFYKFENLNKKIQDILEEEEFIV